MAYHQDRYYTMDAEGRLVIFDYRQHIGNQIYWLLDKEISSCRTVLEEAGMWHNAITPARITGMLLAAGYTATELTEMAVDTNRLAEVTMEAIDLILEEVAKKGTEAFPKVIKRHPDQLTPIWQTLSHEATLAVLAMQPVVVGWR